MHVYVGAFFQLSKIVHAYAAWLAVARVPTMRRIIVRIQSQYIAPAFGMQVGVLGSCSREPGRHNLQELYVSDSAQAGLRQVQESSIGTMPSNKSIDYLLKDS